MHEVKLFPTTTGQSWLEMSSYKDHTFKSPEDMSDKYDFIIVGAGYGGYGAASRLAELNPDKSIALIEAITIGNNDSGKNAGFIIDVPHDFGDTGGSSFEDNKMYFKLNTAIIGRMRDTINNSGIDVDWRDSGKYVCCCHPRSYKMIDTEVHDLEKMGVNYQIYEGEELNRRLGTKYYTKALYTAGSTLVNPADVLRGLCTTLPDNVEIFEETPVLRIDEGSTMSVVLKNGRTITGGHVIVTGGPFIEQFGIVKNVFCPVLSYGAFTRKLTDNELRDFEGVEPWGCTAGHPAGTTVRYTADQRIFVRNGFAFNSQLTTSHQRIQRSIPKLRKAFENRFPNLRHVNFEFVYGGMINMTMNYRPLMTQKSSNLFASACGEGAGVAKTCMMGHYIAEWISGVKSDELNFLRRIAKPSWLPPDPFRTAGARVRLAWEEFSAKDEI